MQCEDIESGPVTAAPYCIDVNRIIVIGGNLAPMLIQHVTADHLVPCAQSEAFAKDLIDKGYGDRVEYVPLEGADHEDKRFFRNEARNLVFQFIEKHL